MLHVFGGSSSTEPFPSLRPQLKPLVCAILLPCVFGIRCVQSQTVHVNPSYAKIFWLKFECLTTCSGETHINTSNLFIKSFLGERKSDDVKPNSMYLYQRDITDEYIEQKFG